jgi:YegS/Rv2252/BmrU family lipid kinase
LEQGSLEKPTINRFGKSLLVYNPYAGKFGNNGSELIGRAVDVLKRQGHDVTVRTTTGPGTAGKIARDAIRHGTDLVLAAGGDGTVNEVVEGMVHSNVPLAVLPGGTANVLATEMKLGSRLERVAARLADCQPRRVSVGQLTCAGGVTRYFLLMAGVGLDAQIVGRVDPRLKARTGKFAYWVAGWSMLGHRLKQFDVAYEVEGAPTHTCCSFALLTKVRNYGGDFEIARNVRLFDDQFEMVLFQGDSTLRYVKYFAGLMLNRVENMKGVAVVRTREATLATTDDQAVFVQIDGELAGRLPATVRIIPDALTLMAPANYGA